jgi:hypothetical protein
MPRQSNFIRLAVEAALCATVLLAVSVTARAGEVRDHRSGSGGGGGVTVTNTSHNGGGSSSTVRDHRTKPVVRDHRKPIVCVVGPFDAPSKCQ